MEGAMYFGRVGTLLWTLVASGAYCWFLIPVFLGEFTLAAGGRAELLLRVTFFFLVGMIVNRFVMDYRRQTQQYQVDRKSTRLNSSHQIISYAVFSLKKKKPYPILLLLDL